MKKLFVILIVLNICYSCSENKKDYSTDSCEVGKKNAINDAKNGKYKLLSYGLMDYDDWEFQSFYKDYLETKHGIITGSGGCIVSDEDICYREQMEELIYNKFGEDIFDRTEIEAEIAFKESVNTKIDTGFIYGIVEVMPEFKGGMTNLFAYLKKNLNHPTKGGGKVQASFVIEKDGSINDIEIVRSLKKEFDDEVIRVLSIMPKWSPGTHHNKLVRVRMVIPVVFIDKEKSKK